MNVKRIDVIKKSMEEYLKKFKDDVYEFNKLLLETKYIHDLIGKKEEITVELAEINKKLLLIDMLLDLLNMELKK